MSQNLTLNRRRFLAVLSALSLAPSAAVAQSSGLIEKIVGAVDAIKGDDAVTLRLILPNGCGANVLPVAQAFEAMTGIKLAQTEVDVDEINTQLLLDNLTDTADYDLALPATFGIPDLANSGAILPLDDFAQTHEPPSWRAGSLYTIGDTFDRKTYGFQTDGDAYVMFYNRDWHNDPKLRGDYQDRFGQTLSIPQTWGELDRQMAYFHDPEQNRYGGALFRTPGYLAWEWWIRFHAKGVWPMSPQMVPQIDGNAGLEALEDMIRASEHLYPKARSAGLFENWDAYSQGNIYANIGWGGSQKFFNRPTSKIRGRMLFGKTPSAIDNGDLVSIPYFNWGWNYVITRVSAHPELAYLFALFASTSEMSTLSVQQTDGYFDPFRPEHYTDPAIIEAYSAAFLEVHESSMREAIPDLYIGDQSAYFSALNDWLDKAVSGAVAPEMALSRVANQWRLITERSNPEEQAKRWQELRAKYPSRMRTYLTDL